MESEDDGMERERLVSGVYSKEMVDRRPKARQGNDWTEFVNRCIVQCSDC